MSKRFIDADVLMKKIIEHINAAINWKDLASANGDDESVIRADQAIASFCEIGLTAKNLPIFEMCKQDNEFDYEMCKEEVQE